MTVRPTRLGAALLLALAAPLFLGACSDDGDDTSADDETTTTTTTATTDGDDTTTTTVPGGPVNAAATVDTNEFSFTPGAVTVRVGEAVTWRNTGSAQHTVTPDAEAAITPPWVSRRIAPDETFVVTLSEPGTYNYFCSIHPDRMQGSVTVTD
jgi:plastocyanin